MNVPYGQLTELPSRFEQSLTRRRRGIVVGIVAGDGFLHLEYSMAVGRSGRVRDAGMTMVASIHYLKYYASMNY